MTLDYVFRMLTGHDTSYWCERGELDWYSAYAEVRQDGGKGILAADWNHFPRNNESARYGRKDADKTANEANQEYNWSTKGRRFQRILEEMGYQLEWSDTVSQCDSCNGCIQTEPDCYGWLPDFHVFDGSITCGECIRQDAAEYLEDIEDNPRAAVTIPGVNLEDAGYTLVKNGFESGFHSGQNDNPEAIYADLKAKGYEGLLFKIDGSGQFDINFSVYARGIPDQVNANTDNTADGGNEVIV